VIFLIGLSILMFPTDVLRSDDRFTFVLPRRPIRVTVTSWPLGLKSGGQLTLYKEAVIPIG
jgi:hypothetical protein